MNVDTIRTKNEPEDEKDESLVMMNQVKFFGYEKKIIILARIPAAADHVQNVVEEYLQIVLRSIKILDISKMNEMKDFFLKEEDKAKPIGEVSIKGDVAFQLPDTAPKPSESEIKEAFRSMDKVLRMFFVYRSLGRRWQDQFGRPSL